MQNNQQNQIASAILIVGILIAGAILLKGGRVPEPTDNYIQNSYVGLDRIDTGLDRTLGKTQAKVTVIEYADFQCPFCGVFFKNTEGVIVNNYVKTGKARFIYRDYAFLGPESERSAEAARCAGDQGKFWEYHDYLFGHQNGENQGNFSDLNLETFATKIKGLETNAFNKCLDSGKHAQEVADSVSAGMAESVNGTPRTFISAGKELTVAQISEINQIIKNLNLPANVSAPITMNSNKNTVSINGALPTNVVTKVIDVLEE